MAERTCSIDDCDRGGKLRRGICNTHYQAALRAAGKGRTLYTVTCSGCGKDFGSTRADGKLCSDGCRALAYGNGLTTKLPLDHPVRLLVDGRSSRLPSSHPVMILIAERGNRWHEAASQSAPLRAAWARRDNTGILAALSAMTERNEQGCWIWSRNLKNGYGRIRLEGRKQEVHRVSLEAKLGKTLGKQAAHHMCATTQCVNPDHLQPVTARDNNAEMLARKYLVSRIADLEAALTALDPSHPLLHEVGVVA